MTTGTIATDRASEYLSHFKSRAYLDQYYNSSVFEKKEDFTGNIPENIMKKLHEIFQSDLVQHGAKAVDVGCGPNIHTIISATAKCNEVVMCDYLESNLNEIRKWLKADPQSFNWNHFIQRACELEGSKGPNALGQCSERVRSKVKQLVQCNVLQEKIFGDINIVDADIVITSLCLEAACSTATEYRNAVARCVNILKAGGILVMVAVLNESFYDVANKKFDVFPLTEILIREAVEAANCVVIDWKYEELVPDMMADYTGFGILTASKRKS